MMNKVYQVYEYTGIQFTEGLNWHQNWFEKAHYDALVDYHDNNGGDSYFKLIRDGILFKQFVGVIQVKDITVEILPKTDKSNDKSLWHNVLLAMLRKTMFLKVNRFLEASLKYKSHSILHLYIDEFLNQTEALLKNGLVKQYSRVTGNIKALKGALAFNEHVTRNMVHKERFYTRHQVYDHSNLFNQILLEALLILKRINLSSSINDKVQRLLFNFPDIEHAHINTVSFQKLIYNRKTEDYRKAIEIAKMIILNYSPDITAGKHNVFAIMFDMNSLWEEYIYRKLLEVESEEISIDFQASDEFWGSRKMKPDLIIEDRGNKYVVDTKWKVINNAEPSDEDLRQIFAYNQYWDTEKGFLLYPKTNESPSTKPKEYHKGLTSNNIKMTCQVLYLNVISESVLNEDIGIELIDLLRDNKLYSDNKN